MTTTPTKSCQKPQNAPTSRHDGLLTRFSELPDLAARFTGNPDDLALHDAAANCAARWADARECGHMKKAAKWRAIFDSHAAAIGRTQST